VAIPDKNSALAWKVQIFKADVLIWQGFNQDVISLLSPPLPAALATNDLAIRRALSLSLAKARLGDFAAALQFINQAEKLAGDSSPVLGEVYRIRGVVELERQNIDGAETYIRRSLEISHRSNDVFLEATALLNLGVIASKRNRFDESIDWLSSAREKAKSLDAELLIEKVVGNLAWAYYRMGNFQAALDSYNQAQISAKDLDIVRDNVRWLNNIGLVYARTSKLAEAQNSYEQSLALAQKIGDPDQELIVLTSLAFLSVQQQHFEKAKEYAQKAFDLAHGRHERQAELYAVFIKGEVEAALGNPQKAKLLFLEVAKDPQTEVPLQWQAHNNLAHVFAQEKNSSDARKQYDEALSVLECARSTINREEFRLPFLTNAAQIYDSYIHFLVSQGNADEALRVSDYSRAQTLAEGLGLLKENKNCGVRPRPLMNSQQVARSAGGPVLFYWLGERQSYLWVLTAKSATLLELPPATDIDTLVQKYRKALLDPPDVLETRNQSGFQLYNILVAPAQNLIPSGSHVTIVADDILNNLNFETLLVPGTNPHYWIEDVTLTNASSLRMLAANQADKKLSGGKLLLIGDPVIPDPKFPPLPSAQVEMQRIEKHFRPAAQEVFSGTAANPSAFFKSKPESFSYIHFVAHGTASQLSPLDSAVILSKSTAEDDSYKLYARDIIAHPLHANLAVISTCYGSGTALYNGEGLVGLSWAFLRAGAHNVVGALWQVSDISTPQLMDQLYAELGKGRSPQDALRAAKLSLLHSEGPFRKPIYWAPFQLYTGS
jgi:CHAT domain-containing protein